MLKRPDFALLALLILLSGGLLVPTAAMAQSDDPSEEDEDYPDDDDDGGEDPDDIDTDDEVRAKKARAEARRKKRKRPVREVVKGPYLKVNIGPIFWLPSISAVTSSTGTEMDVSFGYDIVDTLGFTLSAEVSFFQAITNGTGISSQEDHEAAQLAGFASSPIQGDFRVFGAIAAVRFGPNLGGKRVKRLSLSGHAGGGVGYSPPLVDLTKDTVISRMNAGYGYIMQGRTLGLIQGGASLEYYTRLSHFSLGLDLDFNVIVGGPIPAMGLGTNLFVKYTF